MARNWSLGASLRTPKAQFSERLHLPPTPCEIMGTLLKTPAWLLQDGHPEVFKSAAIVKPFLSFFLNVGLSNFLKATKHISGKV